MDLWRLIILNCANELKKIKPPAFLCVYWGEGGGGVGVAIYNFNDLSCENLAVHFCYILWMQIS